MKTILDLMVFSETKEYSQIPLSKQEPITKILKKPFIEVTIWEIFQLSHTNIFDVSFPDLLFKDLWDRFTKSQKDAINNILQ